MVQKACEDLSDPEARNRAEAAISFLSRKGSPKKPLYATLFLACKGFLSLLARN
jgi:hypothetical protein